MVVKCLLLRKGQCTKTIFLNSQSAYPLPFYSIKLRNNDIATIIKEKVREPKIDILG